MKSILLNGLDLTLEKAISISKGAPIKISPTARKKITASRKLVQRLAQGDDPYYGINTGFGYLANEKIAPHELELLQENIITSHASGYGDSLSIAETRLSMALRLNVLVKGYTGVRYELCQALLNLINEEVYPVIPKYGSVGASGDLAPLAHLSLALIGKGKVSYKGKKMTAKRALNLAGLKPIKLAAKEGLSLVNGTQIMLSIGSISLSDALTLALKSDLVTALSYEAMDAHVNALHSRLHELRSQQGQVIVAKNISRFLSGSSLFNTEHSRNRVQDPYSLRCAPQVHGACLDSLLYSKSIISKELNAVTDNPLVFVDENTVISGGNFHGQPLAMALDFACMAVSELGNISERRLEILLNPNTNHLSPFLSSQAGVDSGLMAAQYLAASLVNENKILANPACTDSIPGNVGIEDHVSMGVTSARKLKQITNNTKVIIAIEMLAAAQAIDLKKRKKLGKQTKKLYHALRTSVPKWSIERILSDDVHEAVEVLSQFSI
ncbi:MAG: histidine ammonia-lyase [Chlamydiota bacterium]